MISVLFLGCAVKHITIGSVDIAEERICVIQLVDGNIFEMDSVICESLKEGDVIQVSRKRKNNNEP